MPFVARKEARLLAAARKEKKEHVFWEEFDEALDSGAYKPSDFSLRDVFESFVEGGREIVDSWNPRSGGTRTGVTLLEAGIDTSAFANISGQIVYTEMMQAYQNPAFIGEQLVRTIQTSFSGEKIPGVTPLGDVAETIGEGQPYPVAGVSEEWIETPETIKRGFIVPVTKEAIFFDRTFLVLERARDVGNWIGVNKEKRILDVVLGITNAYKRNGTAIDTYGDSSGNHDWDNLAASNALVDWTDVENALLLFDGMTEPTTGEPIIVQPTTIIVPTALLMTAQYLLQATALEKVDNQANAGTYRTMGVNPIRNMLQVASSAYVKARTSSASTWFIGEPQRAFAYMQNWPITQEQAPVNSEMEFTHDIVSRFKVSERGAVAVMDPRYMVKCTG